MIANIASDDALILSHRANPAGLNFRERQPDTRPLASTHRAGFRLYCHSKSRSLGGRPQIDADLRALIRRMSGDNPLWVPRASLASCSSSASRSLSPASRSIWSSDANRRPRMAHLPA